MGNNIADAFQQGITGSMVNAMSAAAADPQITQSVTSMLNQLKPTTAQIENIAAEFAAAGQAIPESLTDYLANIDFYTALSGGLGSLQEYLNSLSFTAPVDTEIDWVIKKKLLDGMASRHGLEITDPRLAQIDLRYHDIHPTRGLFNVLKRRGQAASILSEEQIREAMDQAPATTRAALRGRFLATAREHGCATTVDWMRLKINGEFGSEVALPDPFAATDPQVDEMIASMADLGGADAPARS